MSKTTIDELLNEAVTQGMIAMQLSMGDGEPGRREKVLKDTKQALKKVMLDIVGEDEEQDWDIDENYCMACGHQPTDGSRVCICIFNNKLRAKQRKAIEREFSI